MFGQPRLQRRLGFCFTLFIAGRTPDPRPPIRIENTSDAGVSACEAADVGDPASSKRPSSR